MFSPADLSATFPEHSISQPALGVGGFKVAYAATFRGEAVVLKITRDPVPSGWERAEGTGAEGRIAQELNILGSLNTPHVVQLAGEPRVVRIDGRPHLCYEEHHLVGGTLAERISHGPMDIDVVVEIGLDSLDGVIAMWEQLNVVHRDIKPANIGFDGKGRAVLFDLGTAFDPTITDLTDTGSIAPKTPMYAAPEQFYPRAGTKLDFRTDMFGLGVSLLEARLGRHPFAQVGMSVHDYMAAVSSMTLSSLTSLGVEDPLAKTLLRCAQGTVSRRYPTLQKLRSDLEGAL